MGPDLRQEFSRAARAASTGEAFCQPSRGPGGGAPHEARPLPHGLRRGWAGLPVACGVALVTLTSAMPGRAQDVGYSVAFSTATATYPGQHLTGVYIFNSVDLTRGPVRIWVSLPFVRQQSTLEFDPVTGLPASIDETRSGIGDPLIRVDFRVREGRHDGLQLAVAAAVKPSVVDAAGGLGTGATDYAFGGSVFKGFGRTSVFADVLYWNYGSPDRTAVQHSLAYSLGLGRLLGSGRWSSMVSLSGFSRGINGADPPMQVGLAALVLAGRRQSLAINAGIGLNDSSSDFTFGTSWRTTF